MACFDQQELIDEIHHEILVEDDTGSGGRVLAPVKRYQRRAKYGGLPLNFRISVSDEDKDIELGRTYKIPFCEEPVHTKEIIETRMRSRTVESESSEGSQFVPGCAKSASELFVPKSTDAYMNIVVPSSSAVTRLVEECGASLNSPLSEFAQFEAVDEQLAKKILVLFALNGDKEEITRLHISVQASARVSQVIGYCCYRYTQSYGSISGKIEDYQLFLAEDTGEIESDLPPLDKGRAIGDLGFTVLALVRTRKDGESSEIQNVVVYFPDGDQYIFYLDHLDYTLEWLRDETLEKRNSKKGNTFEGMIEISDYDLEGVDSFDKPLNLDISISNSGCVEFVMIRRNSSRGDFHPRGPTYRRQRSAILSPGVRSPLPTLRYSGVFDFSPYLGDLDMSTPQTPVSAPFDGEYVLATYVVQRLHRYRLKWTAKLVIRWTSFDISPLVERKRTFIPMSYQRLISVPWVNVCDVRIDEKKQGQESSWILTITWLPVLDDGIISDVVGEDKMNVRHIAQLYESSNWKEVHVEMKSREEGHEASSQMMSIVHAIDAPAYQVFCHSLLGARRPHQAAEAALMEMAAGPLLPPPSPTKKRGKLRRLAKLSKTLTLSGD